MWNSRGARLRPRGRRHDLPGARHLWPVRAARGRRGHVPPAISKLSVFKTFFANFWRACNRIISGLQKAFWRFSEICVWLYIATFAECASSAHGLLWVMPVACWRSFGTRASPKSRALGPPSFCKFVLADELVSRKSQRLQKWRSFGRPSLSLSIRGYKIDRLGTFLLFGFFSPKSLVSRRLFAFSLERCKSAQSFVEVAKWVFIYLQTSALILHVCCLNFEKLWQRLLLVSFPIEFAVNDSVMCKHPCFWVLLVPNTPEPAKHDHFRLL